MNTGPITVVPSPSPRLREADPLFASMVDTFNSLAESFNILRGLLESSQQRVQELRAEVDSLRAILAAKGSVS